VWRVAEALEYGMVGVNTGAISGELAPFGGVNEAGIDREGSRHGVEEFVDGRARPVTGEGDAFALEFTRGPLRRVSSPTGAPCGGGTRRGSRRQTT
jgi:hypothetical protein